MLKRDSGSRGRGRLLVAGCLGAALVALVSSAAAKPTKPTNNSPDQQAGKPPAMKQGLTLDAVWAKGLTPALPNAKVSVTPADAAVARDQKYVAPTFNIKKLTPEQRGVAMGTTPEAIQGPLVFDSRNLYHNDDHYLELLALSPSYTHVRTKRNYMLFSGPTGEPLANYAGSWGELHFLAAPRSRYLLECAVEAGPQMVISATDDRAQYSVSTSEKASLLYRRDNETAVAVPVFVRLSANYNHWYLDRCELSWTPMP
jgi:hypothetical protein